MEDQQINSVSFHSLILKNPKTKQNKQAAGQSHIAKELEVSGEKT